MRIFTDIAEGYCEVIAQFFRGAHRVTPFQRKPVVLSWDLREVLSLGQELSEFLEIIVLKRLSFKLVLQRAIVSAKRIGELLVLFWCMKTAVASC